MGYQKQMKRLLPAAILLLLITMVSCDRTRNQKGYEYFPDMAHSLAYETYAPSGVFPGGMANLLPVTGTIPRGIIPYQYAATPEGRLQAGKELVNPLDSASWKPSEAKALYERFCVGCHGADGSGKGHLFTSGKFAIQPASLVNDRMKAAPIGEVFHVISVGWNTMGAHGPQIRQHERWLIANYVKKELQKNQNQ
jgi:mono/diheme cytochrome c family protein